MTFGYFLNNILLPIIEYLKNFLIQISNFLFNSYIFKIIVYWQLFLFVLFMVYWLINLILLKFEPREKNKNEKVKGN